LYQGEELYQEALERTIVPEVVRCVPKSPLQNAKNTTASGERQGLEEQKDEVRLMYKRKQQLRSGSPDLRRRGKRACSMFVS